MKNLVQWILVALAVFSPALPATPAVSFFQVPLSGPDLSRSVLTAAQVSFEQVVQELSNPDRAVRLRALRLLKDAAYPEAAVPLATLVTFADDELQLEAIAAELNIFLVEQVVTRKHVGLVVEVRNRIAADVAFSKGPLAIGARPVPVEVLTALRTAARDDNPRVAIEALYAFGTLAVEPAGGRRRTLLAQSGTDLASMIGAANPAYRYAAIRVIGRVFERQTGDEPVDSVVGDAMVGALNDNDRGIRIAAMQALGSMRYERAVAALTEQFQYFGKGELAEAALDAVARIAYPTSALVLMPQLASKNDTLKAIAIEGLARIGDRSRRRNIESSLSGEGDELVLLAGAFSAVLLADAPLDSLAEALRRPKLADRARQYLISAAPGRTAAFSRHAQDPDVQIRAGIADVLGLAGDPAALPIVEAMLRDRDPQVALAAERAAARLNALRRAT
jgi:HEAT repeat protein